MLRGSGAQQGSKPEVQEQRRAVFKCEYMFHKSVGEENSGKTMLDKKKLTSAVCTHITWNMRQTQHCSCTFCTQISALRMTHQKTVRI